MFLILSLAQRTRRICQSSECFDNVENFSAAGMSRICGQRERVAAISMTRRELSPPTCPVRVRWNPCCTDMWPTAILRTHARPPRATKCSLIADLLFNGNRHINIRGHLAMKRSSACISRRKFIAASALAGLTPSIAAACILHPDSRSAQKMGKRVVVTQIVFCGIHPVMENPHLRTPAQINKLVERAGRHRAAINIKLMALSHSLKQPIALSE